MIFNTADPLNTILILAATLLLVYLGKETKNSRIPQIVLFVDLVLIVIHAVQFVTMAETATPEIIKVLSQSLAVNFGLVMVSFLSYLWVDELESKVKKTKVINSGLDWFWKQV